MRRLVAIKKPAQPKAPDGSYKALVMDAWDRLFGEEEQTKRREEIWAKEEIHRKAKARL